MSLLGQRPDVSEFRPRYPFLALGVVGAMLVLVGKLVSLQILGHEEWATIARENIIHRTGLATSRGVIRDRAGVVLAASRESWNVYVIPARLELDKTWPLLADSLGLGPFERRDLDERIRRVREADFAALKANPKHHIKELLVREDVSRDIIGALETHRDELPSVSWLSSPMRYYPQKELTFHLLGFVNEVSKEDLDAQGASGPLQAGDRVGRSGIERAYESVLHGTRGWRKVILDAHGNKRVSKEDEALIDEPKVSPAIPGRDLRLTIDAELTATARKAFAGQLAGGVVAVEIKTGRILVDYSKPGVDGNDFVSGMSAKQYESINQNALRPLIDKTMYEAYFPGSTVKPFFALAALRAHSMTTKSEEECEHIHVEGKTRFKCEGYHGKINFHDAIVRSCNIFFYKLGKHTTLDVMHAMGAEFGLGQRTGIGINHEVPGLLPTTAWYNQHYGGQYHLGFTLNSAIGQGNTKVTLLQLALAYAALGDGGVLHAPQLVRTVEAPPNDNAEDTPSSLGRAAETELPPRIQRTIALDRDQLKFVLDAMHGVVNDESGTAYAERSTKVDIAGKTGTAQVSRVSMKSGIDQHLLWYFNRDHAWFGGFAPYNDPEIAIVVLVEHGGGGGHNAAPIAMRIFEDYFARKGAGATPSKPSDPTRPKGD
ncbi:MAG: penicillin-binding protein 2 [Polyangiales bacterium]